MDAVTPRETADRTGRLRAIGCSIVGGGIALAVLAALLSPVFQASRPQMPRDACRSNLKQFGIALQNYHDHFGRFPPACVFDQHGRPMHSWRVLLLPYFEETALHRLADQYRLDEPWNSPHNWSVIDAFAPESLPYLFRCPSSRGESHETNYLAVVGDEAAWPLGKSLSIRDMKDGTSRTICLVEVADSGIHWAEPRDLPFSQALAGVNPPHTKLAISSRHRDGANVLYCNGSAYFLKNSIPAQTLRALLTANGGEDVEYPEW